jgi:2-C-methyl-D-erythritol 4-phosphate cytidylyltransferase/2-C-methyl-D-erythritol 2,4-cyclodiphosphate synthase
MKYNNIALIVAAGRGLRAGAGLPKQYYSLSGASILERTLHRFIHPKIDAIQVVIHKDDLELYEQATRNISNLLPYVYGGVERRDSVRLGLEAITKYSPKKVLIHDAARPFISEELIGTLIDELDHHPALIAAQKISDTVKYVEGSYIGRTVDRRHLYLAQTPQAFCFKTILTAHQTATGDDFTDDASLCEHANIPVKIIESTLSNYKITTQADIELAMKLVRYETKVGIGFDAHRFIEGENTENFIIIGGTPISCARKIDAHSDGDLLLHAITDAILGAIGAGDIGLHFPPSDSKWRDADSSIFIKHAYNLVKEQCGEIVNIDTIIIGETPKILPHRKIIQQSIADMLALDVSRVSVKATTTEKMGFTGRGEGIAAQAIVSIKFPQL